MLENKKVYEFTITGESLLMHKFNGLVQEKEIKALPEREQAEKHAYRDENDVLYIPSDWVRGALINSFVSRAGNKEKMKTKTKVAPRLTVLPAIISINKKEYVVDKRSVPSGGARGGVRDMCYRPMISSWSATGRISSTLDTDERDMKTMLEIAGEDVGIGSNRINGFGRFMVTQFKKVT